MPFDTDKQTILIVDDAPVNIKQLAGVLSPEFGVLFARDGQSALRIAGEQKVDLILLDVIMPEMDGYATITELKKKSATRHIPVMFVTSLDQDTDEVKGLALGAVDFITKPVNPSLVRARIRNQIELKRHRDNLESLLNERTLEIVTRLVLIAESRDNDTGSHIRRISEYSKLLAQKIGMPARQVETIAQASTMHDIGKVAIPDSILLKTGKLTAEEWDIMKTHSRVGYENLRGSSSRLLQTGGEIALNHHERWDGTGYPQGLEGENIPLSARIVCLVDVFDALVSRRPYKEPWSAEKACDYIQSQRGIFFDPALVDIFMDSREEVVAIQKTYEDS